MLHHCSMEAHMNTLLRAMIPGPIKQSVKRTQQRVNDWHIQRAALALRKSLTLPSLSALRLAWGNPSWVADLSFIQELAQRAQACQGPILDCGSGLTTLVAAIVSPQPVIALEQNEAWAARNKALFNRMHVYNADVRHTPIRSFGDYAWYDATALPKHFSLIICDGPARWDGNPWPSQTPVRYGLLPTLKRHGITADEILFDDADDPNCLALLARWQQDFDIHYELRKASDGAWATIRLDR
jgi:hypothetical protein